MSSSSFRAGAVIPPIPSIFAGRYRLERELGRGGAATVYLAFDERLERRVAVKVLQEELAHALGHGRFLREIRIASQLRHPHIVPVLDFGETDGQLWYVMPHVDGGTLRQRIEHDSQLRIEDALRWCAEIAEALGHAHEQGFVHRDVKPENILLDGDHAWLADFGIARGIDVTVAEKLTSAGIAVGTPAYMSPEQASGASELDGLSDVYSLTCVLYECLAGVPPFVGPTAQSVIAQRFSQAPHPIATYRSTVPVRVQTAIESGLQIVPADRLQARSLSHVLRAESTAETRLPSLQLTPVAQNPTSRSVQRRFGYAIAAALGIAGLFSAQRFWLAQRKLDSSKVVVFPLAVRGSVSDSQLAAGIPSLIGLALEGIPPLRWVEGDNLLGDEAGRDARADHSARLGATRRAGAAYFIDGSVLVRADSTMVVMRLVSADADSVVSRSGASSAGSGQDVATLAIRAVGALLPALMQPGRRSDPSALSDRRPAAIASFLLGEREFRRSRYVEALARYEEALAQDSNLAIAALKAARSARSLFRENDARRFVRIALTRESMLPGANAPFARGLSWFYKHNADSAIVYLNRAAVLAPDWEEVHAALGDAHYYIGVDGVDADSASETHYLAARSIDSAFTPALYHLASIAIRRKAPIEARKYLAAYRRGQSPDTIFMTAVSIAASCQETGVPSVNWRALADSVAEPLVVAGKILIGGAADLTCGSAAFSAVFAKAGPPSRDHYGALLGLNAIAVARGDSTAVRTLGQSGMGAALRMRNLLLLDAISEDRRDSAFDAALEETLGELTSLSPDELWTLGAALAFRGDAVRLQKVIVALKRRVPGSDVSPNPAIVQSLQGRAELLRSDTAAAIRHLLFTNMNATFQNIEWGVFESRAADNLLLSQLALRSGSPQDARKFAFRLEHPQAIANVVFLRAGRFAQLEAARIARDGPGGDYVRKRLSGLVNR